VASEQSILRFSTGTVPSGMRFDFWMSILRQSLWPVSEWREISDFTVELEEASFGCLTSMTETISAHQSYRTHADVEHSGGRCYLLFANQLPWQVEHHGHSERYRRGDSVLVDSQGELSTRAPLGFRGIIIKLPVNWVQTWLPNPEALIGRRIARDTKWGRVFSPIVGQLTPELVTSPPVPAGLLVDQVGAVLALISDDSEVRARPDLLKKIQDCIRERYAEPGLTAADVAAALDVPPQVLHRVLAKHNLTFASQLLDARTSVAVRMLTSRSFDRLTTTEIGEKAGFPSASYFTRVVRKRTGYSPPELRHSLH